MDKLHVWPGIPVPMRLVCLCYLWCVSLSQWEWTWMSGWLLGLCYCKQCAQSARLSVWKKTRMQIFFACIVTQTLLGITPGLICFSSRIWGWFSDIWIYQYRIDVSKFKVLYRITIPLEIPIPIPNFEQRSVITSKKNINMKPSRKVNVQPILPIM